MDNEEKKRDYVGYGNPPAHSRFKPGQKPPAGAGRPRGSRNRLTKMKQSLEATTPVRVGDKTMNMNTLDMALFADGGKVFPRRGQLNFSHLEGDGGIGFRFNIRGRQFLRLDIAKSREGFQVWVKFNDVFARHPVGTASAQPIY